VYWKSNEESVIGDRQKASTLEVKKPVSATSTSNTRADRVHGEFVIVQLNVVVECKSVLWREGLEKQVIC
jgi:hypothetical protein